MIWRIDLADFGLIAGLKPTKKRPSRLLDNLGRNEYPRKSNCTDGLDPVRLPDLQKMILVFCGCSSRRQVAKRSSIDAFNRLRKNRGFPQAPPLRDFSVIFRDCRFGSFTELCA